MFAYIIYTFYFVLTYNTASNSMQLANQALISANIHNNNYRPDGRLLRFLAIVALSFFCLLHYFSGRAGRTLNQILAGSKVCLLFIVFIAGIVRASKNFRGDWAQQSNSNGFAGSGPACARAFLLIVFAFSGWENATFVIYTVSCAAQSI
jgi:amino acid transporter